MSPHPSPVEGQGDSLVDQVRRLSNTENHGPVVRRRDSIRNGKSNGHSAENGKEKRVEILCDGYFYDVTDFIARHPGGDLIKLYVDGDDATLAIQQFHYRTLSKVKATMRGLKRRAANEDEIGLDSETMKRHQELTAGFLEMKQELEAQGMMDPDPLWFATRVLIAGVTFFTGFGLLHAFGDSSLILRALGVLIMTLGAGQAIWFGHETGHNAVTGLPKLDKLIQSISFGLVGGISGAHWNVTHTEHHAMPQHETKDADLKTMPVLAFNKKLVKDAKSNWWILRYQHLLFALVDCMFIILTWRFWQHPRFVWKNRHYVDLTFMCIHYFVVIPSLGVVNYLAMTWILSLYVLGNIALSHTHLPVVEEGKKPHWTEYTFHYTINVKSSWGGWVDWWMAHLNYQLEHHLFPTMPGYKLRLSRDRVKKFAKDFNLPYRYCSYWEAVKLAYENLEKVAHELRHMPI